MMRGFMLAATLKPPILTLVCVSLCFGSSCVCALAQHPHEGSRPLQPQFQIPQRWSYTAPLVEPEPRETEVSHAQKDPTIVRFDNKWHLFMTVKLEDRTLMEYCSFEDWQEANTSKRHLLRLVESKYFCAPQIFFYEPQKLWYLIYQVGLPGDRFLRVAYSTTKTLNDPTSWSSAKYCLDASTTDPRQEGGLDFWMISDADRVYLFYTSPGGKLWRLWTTHHEFPNGFRDCQLAMRGEFFEAAHIYYVKEWQRYLNIIEQDGRRYYKAFVADRLDGRWIPLADSEQEPFAGATNIEPGTNVERWTDNVSHGELIRQGCNERLEISETNWEFLFQGMLEAEKRDKNYGQFTWRLGMLRSNDQSPP